MYGERIGCVSVITDKKEEGDIILSQLKAGVIRPMYSSPPLYGARLVENILKTPELKELWKEECKGMADRIKSVRVILRNHLETLQYHSSLPPSPVPSGTNSASSSPTPPHSSPRRWNHITEQVGMFCYSGLRPAEVRTDNYFY